MQYDYVIAGGGSAGCVLANRLSASGKFKVCLIEAGPPDTSPLIRMPGAVVMLMRGNSHNWQFWTTPQKHMANRAMYMPRGKTLGGSSSINAMVNIRGHAWDYDHWASLGNPGWAYRDVLPYFRKCENYEPGVDAEYHGRGGPLNISDCRSTNPLTQVFLQAAQQAGYKPTPDFNGAQQEGIGRYRVYQKNGERWNNAQAYLREAETRPNLKIITGAQVCRILFEGRRAVGLRYFAAGKFIDVTATREVLLAAGAIGSPQLLLLSGVGAKAELQKHGIAPVHDLPGVGENLQDHIDIVVCTKARNRLPMSLHPLSLLRALVSLFKYLFFRQGESTSNVAEGGAFLKTDPKEPIPDLQWHFVPMANAYHGLDLGMVMKTYGYLLMCCDLRPLSRGRIMLESADPLKPPRIDPNWGAHERDIEKLVIGIRKMREVLAQKAFDEHRGVELEPGPDCKTDAQLRDWVRRKAEAIYHPVGTCKMGPEGDAMAVVDPQLRVRGLTGLRVIDASVMPTLVGGNTNQPTTMIAEKGAELVLQAAA